MKQTIFNASLEESMNLVTDKYIQTAMEDIKEKGYWRKIIGFLTVNIFMYLLYLLGIYADTHLKTSLPIKTSVLVLVPLFISLCGTALYFFEVTKISNNRVLSYYYYNKDMFIVVSCLYAQIEWLMVSFTFSILGVLLAIMLYGVILLFVFMDRYQWFKTSTLEALYGQKEFQNPLARFLEYFTVFAKKYGGIIVLLLIVLRWIFPIDRHNDLVRAMGLVFYSFFMLIGVYFIIALGADNFQGYYIKKYMEEYRELSGYTVEEWYGPRSKKAKENK